jgi:transposase
VLATELFYRKFNNRRKVASYMGLTPTPYNSGSIERDQGISKAGNRRARTITIELAWIWLRNQSESNLSRWFHSRVGTAAGRLRRITIVALARKLTVALWRFVEADVVPHGAVLKMK